MFTLPSYHLVRILERKCSVSRSYQAAGGCQLGSHLSEHALLSGYQSDHFQIFASCITILVIYYRML